MNLERKKNNLKDRNRVPVTPVDKGKILLFAALIVVLGFAVYGNSLNGKFLWDDETMIEENTVIKNWSNLPQMFMRDLSIGSDKISNSYRPLQMVSYMVDYFFWKMDVRGYHLTNILLHILGTLAVFWLVNILFQNEILSLLTSLIFVVHPVHTEAVTYISGRADSMALLFMVLCLIFYIKSLHIPRVWTCILMALSYALALLSRENSLILPVLILLYHYSFNKKFNIKLFLPIVILPLIYIVFRNTIVKASMAEVVYTSTLFQRLPGFFVAIVNYIRLLFFPFGLHMEYGNDLFPWANVKTISGIIIVPALLVYAFKCKKDDNLIFFAIAWFFVALLPVSNIYPINAYMAEHWLYLPSIGFFLIGARIINVFYQKKQTRAAIIVLTVVMLGGFSYLTIRQNTYWREPVDYYKRVLKFAPDSPRIYNNLGKAYNAVDQKEEALKAYKKAVELKPDYAEAYNNIGNIFTALGKKGEALEAYKKAVAIQPEFALAHKNLGILYQAMGRRREALESYKKTVAIMEDDAETYNNLGVTYAELNETEQAIASYKRAIEINPNSLKAYNNLANIYSSTGRYKEAILIYKKAIQLDPNSAQVYHNLSIVCFRDEQYGPAIEYYDKATHLGFVNPKLGGLLLPYRQ